MSVQHTGMDWEGRLGRDSAAFAICASLPALEPSRCCRRPMPTEGFANAESSRFPGPEGKDHASIQEELSDASKQLRKGHSSGG